MPQRPHGINPITAPIYPAYCFSASPTFNKWVKLTAADVHGLRREPGFEGQNIYFHLNHPIRYVYLSGLILDIDFLRGGTITLLKLDDSSGATIEVKISHPPAAISTNTPVTTTPGEAAHAHRGRSNATSTKQIDPESDEAFFSAPSLLTPTAFNSKPHASNLTHETSVPNLTLHPGPPPSLHLSGIPLHPGTLLKAKGTLTLFRNTFQLTLLRALPIPSLAAEVSIWADYAAFVDEVLCKPWVLGWGEIRALEVKEEERRRMERERERAEVEEKRKREERRRGRGEKRRKWEVREEEKRRRKERELDGNALDRVGRKVVDIDVDVDAGLRSAVRGTVDVYIPPKVVLHPRVKALGGRPVR